MSFNIFLNLYKRTEKLSAAVFLVSNNIQNQEFLRTKIQNSSVDILSYCTNIKDTIQSEKTRAIGELESAVMKTTSLLDMALISGLVSEMNISILRQEFNLLLKSINELKDWYENANKLSTNFFSFENSNPALESGGQPQSSNGNGVNNYTQTPISKNLLKDVQTGERMDKDRTDQKQYREKDREKAILEVLKNKGKVNIKDISRSIKSCSEKTIQRKLLALIQNGMIKKEGERRWSMYSLAT